MAKTNSTWKVIATVGGFIIVIVGAAITYGMLANDVDRTHEEVDDIKAEIIAIKPKVEKNNINIATVNKDIYYIQQDIEEIKGGIATIIKKIDK